MQGVSGNPAGRPAGSGSIVAELRRQVQQEDASGASAAQRIAAQLLALAQSGDLRAIREVIDRLDGAAKGPAADDAEPITLGKITL